MAIERDVLAKAIRDARENRGMSREAAAKRLGLSRTVLAQIELGNRRVSDDELGRFATLYDTSVADLAGVELPGSEELDVMVFELAPELLLEEGAKANVSSVLELLGVALNLEQALGRKPRCTAHYSVPSPSGAAEAIAQGEQAAEQERRRLGLLNAPIGNVVELVSSQGIHVSAVRLPDFFAGFFLRHRYVGSAIVVNSVDSSARRRFSVLNSYAHSLFEPGKVFRTTKRSNAGELIAKRANAFAGSFLLPEEGVRELLENLGKGQPSRKAYVVPDLTTDDAVRAEHRTVAGSQAISFADVAAIARRFGASYKSTVLRLLSLGIISESDTGALLATKPQRAAEQCLAIAGVREECDDASSYERSGLKSDVLRLAIECYRRALIKRERLGEIAEMLQLPNLSKTKLIELAEAAR
jgi:Zn-dependent peptidase ImmA (M78 family)